jgi:proline iminopeptidase
MRPLHPPIEPFRSQYLTVGRHRIYVEQCGNPRGLPVLFLHGGPGSGCRPDHRRFFDPIRWHAILVDQRGAGRSGPQGELRDNHTEALLSDLESIRQLLQIDRWVLFAGSWGATLALLYAQRHPRHVAGMILRGTFLARRKDLQWFIASGAPRLYPEQWTRVVACLPNGEAGSPVVALDRMLNGTDELAQRRAAREWTQWGNRVALGEEFDPDALADHVPAAALHQARIELHYARHHYFIEEDQVLRDCDERLGAVPVMLIHGRRDLVCPVDSSIELKRRLPQARVEVLPKAGHLARGEPMIDALVRAVDEMAVLA